MMFRFSSPRQTLFTACASGPPSGCKQGVHPLAQPCQVNPAGKVSQRKKLNMKSHKGHKDTKIEASLEGRM